MANIFFVFRVADFLKVLLKVVKLFYGIGSLIYFNS